MSTSKRRAGIYGDVCASITQHISRKQGFSEAGPNPCQENGDQPNFIQKEQTIMDTYNELGGSVVELEKFPGRADIEISKVLTTTRGDKFRAVLTTSDDVVLTAVGQPNDTVVILTGDLGSWSNNPVIYKEWYDMAIDIGIAIGKKLFGGGDGSSSGGGGGPCTTTVTFTFVNGKVASASASSSGCQQPK